MMEDRFLRRYAMVQHYDYEPMDDSIQVISAGVMTCDMAEIERKIRRKPSYQVPVEVLQFGFDNGKPRAFVQERDGSMAVVCLVDLRMIQLEEYLDEIFKLTEGKTD